MAEVPGRSGCGLNTLLSTFLLYSALVCYTYQPQQLLSPPPPARPAAPPRPRIWASMGLCYSFNTKEHGKAGYPYKDVTPLALLLWRHHLPAVRTIVRIVYTEREVNIMMEAYGEMLQRAGAVVEWIKADGMDCVLKSQLVRLFAVENAEVGEDDIVMTVDVNLFVMTPDIVKPILSHPDMIAWVPQYHDTVSARKGWGETFNQNLIAMRAKTWKNITGYRGNLTELVDRFRATVKLPQHGPSSWFTDQLITTHALLSSGVCSAPASSGLWRMPGLHFQPGPGDAATCWHGRGYKDCNKDIHIVYQGCKWWHFYPFEKLSDHVKKFYELTENTIKLDIHILTK